MIITKRRLWFKTISIMLEDDQIDSIIKSGKYASIVILSYQKLDLSNFDSFEKPTLLIDLTRPEDDILHGFNDTTRNEIRRTFNNKALSFKNTEVSDESYTLYKEFEYSQGRVPTKRTIFKGMKFFGAYYNGKLISGIYVIESFPYLIIRSIFSKRLSSTEDKEMYKIIGQTTRRLVWEICRLGKEKNYSTLDLASVNLLNPKTASIAKFKMSFGKDLIPFYTYIYKSSAFTILEQTVKVKLFVKKFLFRLQRKFS